MAKYFSNPSNIKLLFDEFFVWIICQTANINFVILPKYPRSAYPQHCYDTVQILLYYLMCYLFSNAFTVFWDNHFMCTSTIILLLNNFPLHLACMNQSVMATCLFWGIKPLWAACYYFHTNLHICIILSSMTLKEVMHSVWQLV